MPQWLLTVVLLICSNIFMTIAWYYHLKEKSWPLAVAILASWGVALFEYIFQVPANRYGHVSQGGPFTAPQLKIIQEAITLAVFSVFSILVLREKPRPHDLVGFALIFAGVFVSMLGKRS